VGEEKFVAAVDLAVQPTSLVRAFSAPVWKFNIPVGRCPKLEMSGAVGANG
jgi:hypothetical protein